MWHKVSWLVFWVSMVLWFGNLLGCATPNVQQQPHYNVSEPAPKAPSRDDYGRSVLVRDDVEETVPVAFLQDQPGPAAPAPAPDATNADAPKPADAPKTEAPKTTDAAAPATPAPADDTPSLKGMDRSHWAKIKTGPDIGVTRHYPLYYKDCPFDRPEPAINENDSADRQLEAALAGAQNNVWDWFHGQQMLAQPVKFGYDTVLLLPKMVITPPWREKTTP